MQPHLADGAAKLFRRVRVDAEADALARPDAADIRLVQVRDDLHLRQVCGEDEQGWRLHAGGDRLSDVDIARDHEAIDRGRDDRVLEVHFVLVQRRLGLDDLGLCRLDLRIG